MSMRKAGWMCAAGCALAMGHAVAGDAGGDYDPRFYVSPMYQYVFHPDDHLGVENGYGGILNVGKRLTRVFEFELSGQYAQFDSNSPAFPGTMRQWGVGGEVNLYPLPSLLPHGYLLANIDYGHTGGAPGPTSHYSSTLFDLGAGYNIPLDAVGSFVYGWSVRLELRYRLDLTNKSGGSAAANPTGVGDKKSFSDELLAVGLRIPIGGGATTPPPAPPAPTQVVPVVAAPSAGPAPPPAPAPCTPPAAGEKINLEGCKSGDVIILHGVNFEFDQARLTTNAKTILDGVADALTARKDINVEIDGHTDGKGGLRYNQRLSERRAVTVMKYLEAHGVEPARMSVKGFGKTRPIADNSTDEGRELNRRVELKIVSGNAPGEAAPPAPAPAPPSPPAEAPAPPSPPAEAPAAAAPAAVAPAATSDTAPPAPAISAPAAEASPPPPAPGASTAPAAPADAATPSGP